MEPGIAGEGRRQEVVELPVLGDVAHVDLKPGALSLPPWITVLSEESEADHAA